MDQSDLLRTVEKVVAQHFLGDGGCRLCPVAAAFYHNSDGDAWMLHRSKADEEGIVLFFALTIGLGRTGCTGDGKPRNSDPCSRAAGLNGHLHPLNNSLSCCQAKAYLATHFRFNMLHFTGDRVNNSVYKMGAPQRGTVGDGRHVVGELKR